MNPSIWHTYDELPFEEMWKAARIPYWGPDIVVLRKNHPTDELPIQTNYYIREKDECGVESLQFEPVLYCDYPSSYPVEDIEYWTYTEDFMKYVLPENSAAKEVG